MNKKLIAFATAVAVLAPIGASAMPVAAPVAASFEGAKIERTAVIIRTRPRVRRAPVIVRRAPVVRRRAPAIVVR